MDEIKKKQNENYKQQMQEVLNERKDKEREEKENREKTLSILIISILAFGVPAFWKYSAYKLGDNQNYIGYININGNILDFPLFATYCMVVFCIFILIITYIISVFVRNHLIKTTMQKYPNERLLIYFFPTARVMCLIQVTIGLYFGYFILPFFLSPEVTQVHMVTRQNLLFHILYWLAALISAILYQAYTVILTDKRLMGVYRWLGEAVIPLNEIKSIKKTFIGYDIIYHKNSVFQLKTDTKVKKCVKKLRELLRIGLKNEQK